MSRPWLNKAQVWLLLEMLLLQAGKDKSARCRFFFDLYDFDDDGFLACFEIQSALRAANDVGDDESERV